MTCFAQRTAVIVHQVFGHLFANHRLQYFFFKTSCSICLSRLRSATSCLRCLFSSSSWRKRRSSLVPMPPYFFFQLKNVAWEMPNFRQTSSTLIPDSACLSAKAICASVNFDFFKVFRVGLRLPHPRILPEKLYFTTSLFFGGRSLGNYEKI
jgi:hypothetical protein